MIPALIPMGAVIGGIASGIAGLVGRKKRERAQQNALRVGFDFAKDGALGQSFLPTGAAANDAQAALLGLGGDSAAQKTALNNFFSTPGFEFIRDRALEGVTSSAAAAGKLNSGATLAALQDRAGQIAATQLPQFFNALGSVAGRGLQAGQSITNAGTAIGANSANIKANAQANTGSSIGRIVGGVGNFLFGDG